MSSRYLRWTCYLSSDQNENWLEQDTMDRALHSATLSASRRVWHLTLFFTHSLCSCLDLEVPYRGIWNVCDRIRECLTPEQQYQDVGLALQLVSLASTSDALSVGLYRGSRVLRRGGTSRRRQTTQHDYANGQER